MHAVADTAAKIPALAVLYHKNKRKKLDNKLIEEKLKQFSMKEVAKSSLPPSTWEFGKKSKSVFVEKFHQVFELFGLNVARRNDYYSPLPDMANLKTNLTRWNRPSALTGIEYNIGEMKNDLSGLLSRYYHEFASITPHAELLKIGYGPGYPEMDAMLLYMTIRDTKPKRYIEVGSGLSTYYCSLAAEKNAEEGFPLQITCIEPYPYKKLYEIRSIEVIAKEVQDVEVSFFQQLGKGDVFFIDSSHILKIDGDVPFLFLEVLPSLKSEVTIHIHDIPFPYNIPYPAELWILRQNWPMFWNEAMVLQTFLCFNNRFKITMSTPIIRYFDESFLKQQIEIYKTIDQNPNTFSSIWLKKTG
ncbi:MAG TPA: class I SAM-dependent methyltransferase [Chitinophagaceae bacterium]|nr:class I SAM-dependent methyltransferase [Chitinophagaceae bacterium]